MAAVRHLRFVIHMRETTHDVFFVVFITVQDLVRIGSVVLIISKFNDFCDLAENCIYTPFSERFVGIFPPKWKASLTGHP